VNIFDTWKTETPSLGEIILVTLYHDHIIATPPLRDINLVTLDCGGESAIPSLGEINLVPKNKCKFFFYAGLRRVLDLIAEPRGLHLDEANEFIKDPLSTNTHHPFTLDHDSGDEGTSKKRKAPLDLDSGDEGPSKKRKPPKNKKGIFQPKHCKLSEKYGSENTPTPILNLIKKTNKKEPTFKNTKEIEESL